MTPIGPDDDRDVAWLACLFLVALAATVLLAAVHP